MHRCARAKMMAVPLISPNTVPKIFHLANRNSLSFRPSYTFLSSSSSSTAAIRLDALNCGWKRSSSSCRKKRLVVVRAGPPSNTSLIFAFVFPLSLLIVTIFTSIRIADKLDRDYLEELAINKEIMEEDGEDGDMIIPVEEEQAPALPRSRNRPKREA
ncbi:uncharacterized protein LOC131250851 [Magnolia sinica]|uniref:uncharacterized protein LOC131250851 n=1 Tax=Magnolia sinica TaxID=86752 RepID=UPI00265AE8F3|nr:uncharacterized protein LOC131250851 [Magnolia sinica]